MYGHYDHGWMFDGGNMFLGGVWMVLLWIVPLLMLFALLKYLFSTARGDGSRKDMPEKKTSLDILKDAYARGDIKREEFLQKRDDILEK